MNLKSLILVEGGTLLMGDTYEASITHNYWIGKYPVTFEEYDKYVTAMDKIEISPSDEGWGRVNRPVINVNWWHTINYCNWLSDIEKLAHAYDYKGNLLDIDGIITEDITKVVGYRLPTGVEWEYAAKGGNKQQYGWKYSGSDDLNVVGWYWQNSGSEILIGKDNNWDCNTISDNNSKTQPVGQKKSNQLGIYDMSGNVDEWCNDRIPNSGSSPGYVKNSLSRVLRGGSWASESYNCSVIDQSDSDPNNLSYFIGFRIAKTDSVNNHI